MRWPKNFSSFNPSLLPPLESDNTDPHLVFFRVSNMNYCRHTSWKDRMRLQTHLRSYLALAHVDAHDEWRLRSPATVLRDASSLFRLDGEACARYLQPGDGVTGTFSGPEDPRAFWSPSRPHVPWLFVSAWTDDCARLRMHLVKLPGWRLDDGTSEQQRPQQLLLHVDDWPPMAPIADPESQPVQKNWLPFVLEGELFAEYATEMLSRCYRGSDVLIASDLLLIASDRLRLLPSGTRSSLASSCASIHRLADACRPSPSPSQRPASPPRPFPRSRRSLASPRVSGRSRAAPRRCACRRTTCTSAWATPRRRRVHADCT